MQENVAKEKEERKITLNTTQEQDDIPLFYSHVSVSMSTVRVVCVFMIMCHFFCR